MRNAIGSEVVMKLKCEGITPLVVGTSIIMVVLVVGLTTFGFWVGSIAWAVAALLFVCGMAFGRNLEV